MVIPPANSGNFGADPLSGADLEEICAIIYQRSGMVFGETKRYYIERRVTDLISQRKAQSAKNYISILRGDLRETELLINSFTVNETYFYREQHQLACLSNSILPDVIKAKVRAIVSVSGPCPVRAARSPILSPSGCSKTGRWWMPIISRLPARISIPPSCGRRWTAITGSGRFRKSRKISLTGISNRKRISNVG